MMASRWMKTGSWGWVFSAFVAVAALGCGESEGDDGDDGGSDTGGASTGGSSSGGSSSGGAAGSGVTGGAAGSSTGGAAGSGGSDPCGGCGPNQMCIYQVGGPGPGRLLCAEDPICRAAGECDCIQAQGDCMPAPPGGEFAVMCQCDNGLE
jgi:hypothetical protein